MSDRRAKIDQPRAGGSRASRLVLSAALGAVAALTACGTQVSHDRIVAAAGQVAETGHGGVDLGLSNAPGADVMGTDGGAAAEGTTGGAGAQGTTGAPGRGPAAAAGGAGRPTVANLSPVTIGNIGSYSGVLGSIFPGGASAVQAWAQDVNTRGGLNGHPVKIVSGDDGGDPSRALALARQMVEEQGAIGFAGNMMPLSLSGIRKYLEDNSIPLVGGDVTLPDWIESPAIFPSGTDVTSISVAAIRLLGEAGGTKLAILFCGESPSCGALARAAESDIPPGMTLKFTSQISIVQTDFTTECLRAKDAGVDTIFVAADANTVIRVGRSCSQQGVKPLYGTASIAVGPQLADDPNMEGLIAPTNNAPWFDGTTPGGSLFLKAMRSYAPGTRLDAPSASQFASGLLIEAASAGLGATPTSAQLIAGLRGLRSQTAEGLAPSLTFRNGPTGPVKCYFVVRVKSGHWMAPNGANPKCI